MRHTLSMHKRFVAAVLTATFAISGSAFANESDTDVSHGALLAITCFACHGFEGSSPGNMPSIRGYPADFLVSVMQTFRDGERPNTVMGRHATGYNDAELRIMAEYIEKLSQSQ